MLLDRSQIERWAESFPAQGDFPQLIQRLVYAPTPGLVKCNIPFGSAVNMGRIMQILENKLYICGEKAAAVLQYRGLWQMGNRCIN